MTEKEVHFVLGALYHLDNALIGSSLVICYQTVNNSQTDPCKFGRIVLVLDQHGYSKLSFLLTSAFT